jgi:hypothetical protein
MSDTDALVAERGAVYGDPKDDFARVAHMAEVLKDCPDPLARHSLYMILVKVSRLIHSPDHVDSWRDISGYALCGERVASKG